MQAMQQALDKMKTQVVQCNEKYGMLVQKLHDAKANVLHPSYELAENFMIRLKKEGTKATT